jgi:hypothetical protein
MLVDEPGDYIELADTPAVHDLYYGVPEHRRPSGAATSYQEQARFLAALTHP